MLGIPEAISGKIMKLDTYNTSKNSCGAKGGKKSPKQSKIKYGYIHAYRKYTIIYTIYPMYKWHTWLLKYELQVHEYLTVML